MMTKNKTKKSLLQAKIDQIVIAQADDDSAWEEPIHVHGAEPTSLALPADLAARAAFLARLHRQSNVKEWLLHIIQERLDLVIQERLDLEEQIYVEVKRELSP